MSVEFYEKDGVRYARVQEKPKQEKTRHFKIEIGYDQNNIIPITEEELPKAIACHMTGGKATFTMGSVSGSQITAVVPDWHSAMGWNLGYKMQSEDWNDVKPMQNEYRNLIQDVKSIAQRLVGTEEERMLNQPLSVLREKYPMLEENNDLHQQQTVL